MVHGANVARELRARPDFESAECRIWCKLQTEIPRCALSHGMQLVSCRLYSHAYFVYRYFKPWPSLYLYIGMSQNVLRVTM
jgi:hypothetical protein